MLKKTVKYIDFNDVEQEETLYFNLTELEVTELEVSAKGGLAATLEKIVKEDDYQKIVETFQMVVLKAYGEKSPDGKYFTKNAEIMGRFLSSAVYSALFMEIVTSGEAAAAFIEGILPKRLLAASKN